MLQFRGMSMSVVAVAALWTLSFSLMMIGAVGCQMIAIGMSLLVGLIAMIPTVALVLVGVLNGERHMWMDGIAESLARAVIEEASVTRLRR